MKKYCLSIFIVCLGLYANANPLIAPNTPFITEIFFDSLGNWTIECFTDSPYDNLKFDSLSIETSAGISKFVPGIVNNGKVVLITKDSLQKALSINMHGDFIRVHGLEKYVPVSETIFYFGEHEYSQVPPISLGQSYAMVNNDWLYYFVKENMPSPGTIQFETQTFGTMVCEILDKDLTPIPSIRIRHAFFPFNSKIWKIYDQEAFTGDWSSYFDIVSNEAGKTETTNLSSREYVLSFFSEDKLYRYDTTILIRIEPDSINAFKIQLSSDLIYVGLKNPVFAKFEMKASPNPCTGHTTISVSTEHPLSIKKGILKLFSMNGELLQICPATLTDRSLYHDFDLSMYPPGMYYCNLDVDGRKAASIKIMLSR